MYTILSVLQVFICFVLIFLVLLHSGKDSGLSGAFGIGGAGAGPFGGGSLVERNLNRWTIAFAVALGVNTIILLKI
ncbi:MAG TPA: preprotein translocase subunit SecG [Solirubrobacterales bacterium]|nr:preprotein translocase subunit SecG [Solirubrobacterales bacterium]